MRDLRDLVAVREEFCCKKSLVRTVGRQSTGKAQQGEEARARRPACSGTLTHEELEEMYNDQY